MGLSVKSRVAISTKCSDIVCMYSCMYSCMYVQVEGSVAWLLNARVLGL